MRQHVSALIAGKNRRYYFNKFPATSLINRPCMILEPAAIHPWDNIISLKTGWKCINRIQFLAYALVNLSLFITECVLRLPFYSNFSTKKYPGTALQSAYMSWPQAVTVTGKAINAIPIAESSCHVQQHFRFMVPLSAL